MGKSKIGNKKNKQWFCGFSAILLGRCALENSRYIWGIVKGYKSFHKNFMETETTPAEDASAEAIHKAKNAAQAVEVARQAQLAEAVEASAVRTKEMLLEGLKEVFGDSDSENPKQMKVLVQRIPILCQDIMQMKNDIKSINDNFTWGIRILVGAIILAVLKVVLIP